MSSTTRSAPYGGVRRVTAARVALSEWTKLRTLSSTPAALATAVVVTVALSLASCAAAVARWDQLTAAERLRFNPIDWSLSGVSWAQLPIGVLGVLAVAGEYGTGSIRASLTAVPRRLPVLWAKCCTVAATTLVVMAPTVLMAFLTGQAILTRKHLGVALSHPGAPRAVLGAVCYLTVVAVLGAAFGAVLRTTTGAISALASVLLVLPLIGQFLPGSWAQDVTKYLPGAAGQTLMTAAPIPGSLAPWPGFALFCGYTIAVLLAGAVTLARRDA